MYTPVHSRPSCYTMNYMVVSIIIHAIIISVPPFDLKIYVFVKCPKPTIDHFTIFFSTFHQFLNTGNVEFKWNHLKFFFICLTLCTIDSVVYYLLGSPRRFISKSRQSSGLLRKYVLTFRKTSFFCCNVYYWM